MHFLEHSLTSNNFAIQTASSLSKSCSSSKRQSLVKINNFFATTHFFHVFTAILICSFLPVRVACFDYDVQTMPISKQKQSTVNYYVNYYQDKFNMDQSFRQNPQWFSLKQDVVRIKLGNLSPENGIVNVYKGLITQIVGEESFEGSESSNQMCDIVKVINSEEGFNKYLVNHHLNKNQIENQSREEYFLSTAHMSSMEITKYNQSMIQQMNNLFKGSDGPLLRLYEQKRQKITLYSVTNELNIHQISVTIKSGDFYKHSPQRSESPSMMILEDQRILSSNTTTTIYSPNLSEINFEVEHCSKVSQSLLNKYKPDNNKYIELIQIEDNLLMKCISEQVESDGTTRVNIGLFVVQLSQNVDGHSWRIKKQSNVDINVEVPSQNILYKDSIYDSIQLKVLQSSSKEEKDAIYIKTINKLFKVEMGDQKLQLRELTPMIKNEAKFQFVTMVPIHVKNAPRDRNYLWLVQKNNGLLLASYQNTNASQINLSIELTQNFNNTLSVDHIQSLSYAANSNIKIPFGLAEDESKNNGFAVLEVIVLAGVNKNKQFIIEIFHETRSLDNGKLAHLLHVNKIYHNYNVNTNKGYYFSDRFTYPETLPQQDQQDEEEDESQSSFINKIERVIFPETQSNLTNNLGIIQTQHKITFFQYGVPRTISPQVSVATQNLKEDNYGNIADASYLYADSRNIKVVEKKSLSQSEVEQKIIQYSLNKKQLPSYIIRNPIQDDDLQRIVLTLDRYLVVIQVNPTAIYHYEYVCNLNSIGRVNEKHRILNDVTIDLSEICQNSDGTQESEKLVYCEERQTIKFVINYQTLQSQKDYFMHTLFFVIFIVLFITNLIVVLVFWKKIKEEAQKLLEIRKRKKQKTVFNLNNSGKEEPKNMVEE